MEETHSQVSHQDYESDEEYLPSPINKEICTRKITRGRFSSLWNTFTIINENKGIARCNICGVKLSFKSSVTNLKKHVVRKHNNYDTSIGTYKRNSFKEEKQRFKQEPSTVDIGSLKELIQNAGIVGEEVELINEDGSEVPQVHIEEGTDVVVSHGDIHNYCIIENPHSLQKPQGNKAQYNRQRPSNETNEEKRSRLLDLQLECLEMKRYTMQMEALMLEQQLNLPRSLYTKPLREVDVYSRGTQTDVGGDKTKVFYVTDKAGDSQGAHIFQFRATSSE